MMTFRAPIGFYDFKKYVYTCVYFSEPVLAQLPLETYPRLRINATIDAIACKGALMPDKVGSNQTIHLLQHGYALNQKVWYFQVPKKLLERIGKAIGDVVEVTFEIADQDEVDIHPAVARMLAKDDELRAAWERLTPSKQRTLMYPILAAKTDTTREKRVLAFLDELTAL
jgi:hypothetical protein